MAAVNFQETNTAGVAAAAYCSPSTANTASGTRQATEGGAAGGTAVSVTMNASAVNLRAVYFEVVVATGYTWGAGNYVVRLNVTATAANSTWTGCYVCRVNAANVSQATIGSLTGQSIALSSTGVKSMTVAGASQTPAAGDKVVCVLVFSNAATMTQAFGFTPNQLIDTPIDNGLAAGPPAGSLALLGVGK